MCVFLACYQWSDLQCNAFETPLAGKRSRPDANVALVKKGSDQGPLKAKLRHLCGF